MNLIFLGAVLGLIPSIVFAQNSTNSPYTRYGYGNLADKAFISQRGMGGIGIGLRNSQMINPMNPSSFSSVDSMTFMFDFGITGQVSWLKEGAEKEQRLNGNLEYIALQFPVAKRFGVGAGFEPVSQVGYQYADVQSLPIDSGLRQDISTGAGGQSKVYAVLSYDLMNQFSVGVKLSYLFGDITHGILNTYSSNIYNTNWTDSIRSYGFLYDFGVQYHHEIGKFKMLTIGAIYSPKVRFGVRVKSDTIRSDPSSGLIMSDSTVINKNSVFEMPETYGLGFTYSRTGKFTVGADALYQRWADVKYNNQSNVFNNRLKFNIGGEFIPNRTNNNNLLSRIRYRGGLYYTDSYLKVKDSKYNEYGVNLGLGIPILMPDKRQSFINLALEYSRVQPEANLPLSEQYVKISLSYTFNELWFRKLKVQ